MTLLVFAVAEPVILEKPSRATSALFVSLWMLVNLLVCKIYDPHFVHEHA